MAPRKVGPVLVEILDAIDGIQNVTTGKTFAEFESSWLLRLATQRALEIISEATRHIPDELLGRGDELRIWDSQDGLDGIQR